jgi:ketosteroid isomerase-like protein
LAAHALSRALKERKAPTMRSFIALLSAAFLFAILPVAGSRADDAEQVKAVNAAIAALDAAFERRDEATITSLMTPDHLAVTPYYDGPQDVAQVLASLKDYHLQQTMLSPPRVTMLSADVAVRTLTAKVAGTFAGKPLTSRRLFTEIVVRRDGKWLEMLYQITPIGP